MLFLTPVIHLTASIIPVHGTWGLCALGRRRTPGSSLRGGWVGGRCRNPRRSGHFLHSLLKLKTLINQCAPQPSTALGIDLTGVLGNGETTDTRTENLGSGGTCTHWVYRMQLDKEAGLVNVGSGLCRDAISGQKHPEGGRKDCPYVSIHTWTRRRLCCSHWSEALGLTHIQSELLPLPMPVSSWDLPRLQVLSSFLRGNTLHHFPNV